MGKAQRSKLQAFFDKRVSQSLMKKDLTLLTHQMIDFGVKVSELMLFIKLPVD